MGVWVVKMMRLDVCVRMAWSKHDFFNMTSFCVRISEKFCGILLAKRAIFLKYAVYVCMYCTWGHHTICTSSRECPVQFPQVCGRSKGQFNTLQPVSQGNVIARVAIYSKRSNFARERHRALCSGRTELGDTYTRVAGRTCGKYSVREKCALVRRNFTFLN